MATMRWAQAQLAVKVEGAEGTAEALTATEATIKAENITLKSEAAFFPRNASSASLSKFRGTKGGPMLWRATFEVALAGSGTAGTPPSYDPLFQGAFCKPVNIPATSDSYKPSSSSTYDKSITFGLFAGGKRYLAHGARCNLKHVSNAGEVPKLQVEALGVYNTPTDVTALSGITYESTGPYEMADGVFTVGGTTGLLYRTFDFDLGNVLVPRKILVAGNTAGVFSVAIAKRDPKGTLVLEEELAATKDFWALWEANTEQALVIGPCGPAAGNYMKFSVPKAQITLPDLVNIEDLMGVSLAYEANRNSDTGDDECEWLFT